MTDVDQSTTYLSISDVASRTGLTVHGLRFYEREGLLLNPVRRDSAGRRMYSADDVEWLQHVLLKLKASGMALSDIRRYADLVRDGTTADHNLVQRLELMKRHRARLTEQLDEMQSCLKLVDYKIGIYSDALGEPAPGGSLP